MEIADPIGYFDALANDSYFVSNSNFCLSESYKHYLAIMGILEYQYLSDRINALPADKAKEKIKISIADLNFIEEAMGYENLIKEHSFTQQQLAGKLGKNQSTIANKLRILRLPTDIKIKLVEHGLTERHARALLKLPEESLMRDVLDKVIKSDLNVKKTEKLIADILEELKNPKDSDDKKQNVKGIMGMRIYLNTIKQAYEAITNTGLEAKYKEVDKGDHIEVVVRIPKK